MIGANQIVAEIIFLEAELFYTVKQPFSFCLCHTDLCINTGPYSGLFSLSLKVLKTRPFCQSNCSAVNLTEGVTQSSVSSTFLSLKTFSLKPSYSVLNCFPSLPPANIEMASTLQESTPLSFPPSDLENRVALLSFDIP